MERSSELLIGGSLVIGQTSEAPETLKAGQKLIQKRWRSSGLLARVLGLRSWIFLSDLSRGSLGDEVGDMAKASAVDRG